MTTTKGYFQPPGGQYCKRMDDIKKEIEKSEQQRFKKQQERLGTGTNATLVPTP